MMHRHVQDFDGDGSKLLVGGPFIDYICLVVLHSYVKLPKGSIGYL